ncbi:Fic family protein [Microcoleus sp. F8-D3]
MAKRKREHLEFIGHRDAIAYIEMLTRSDTAIGEWEIKQIHNLIIRALLFVGLAPVGAGNAYAPEEVGRYRQLDVKATGTEYLYPPNYLLSGLMPEFIQWLNSDKIKLLHPLEYAAEAHLRFVSIHPFRDGNGRAGRLLMNLLLLRAGYPIVIISNQMLEVLQQQSQELDEDSPLINIQEPAPFL